MTVALPPVDQTDEPQVAPNTRLLPLTYTPDDGLNLTYGESVAFYPSADSPSGFDLDGEYYGAFDAFRIVRDKDDTRLQVRVIRQGDRLWLPMANVFKLRDAGSRIPPKGRRL